jgi:hypothetical protein
MEELKKHKMENSLNKKKGDMQPNWADPVAQ